MIRYGAVVLTVVAAALIFVGDAQAQKKLDKVKVATQGIQFTYGPYFVAKLGGFFEREGFKSSGRPSELDRDLS